MLVDSYLRLGLIEVIQGELRRSSALVSILVNVGQLREAND
jgi:hypothetical protein